MAAWDDVTARARGLATHLLRPEQLAALAHAGDVPAFAALLERDGYRIGAEGRVPTPADLERAVRRRAAARLKLLARWCGTRAAVLAVIFEEEDRRSIETLVRGAAEGSTAEARLAGLVPTPELPLRALEELAALASPRAIGALLAAWHHPLAGPVLGVTGKGPPDLLHLEAGLARLFAERATRAARRGDWVLRQQVRTVIDLENVVAAVLLAEEGEARPAEDLFLPGGERVTPKVFAAACAATKAQYATRILGGAFTGTPYLHAILACELDAGRLDAALVAARHADLRRTARLHPLTTAPILAFALGIRLEVLTLQRVLWGITLGAPEEERLPATAHLA
jgi:vacuolar-type H+-ATPase subunit C/Vma6